MQIARNAFTAAITGVVVRQVYQPTTGNMNSTSEVFIKIVKDGTEYWDLAVCATAGDLTTLLAALGEGHYNTVTYTPGATVNDEPTLSAATLV